MISAFFTLPLMFESNITALQHEKNWRIQWTTRYSDSTNGS